MMATDRPIALVTGAAKRIGRAIALRLGQDGWDIALHYNSSRADAEAVSGELAASGARGVPVHADLGDHDETRGLMPACAEALGAPVCLINNASIFQRDTVTDFTDESWQAHQDVNLRAPLVLAQGFAEALPAGQTGNIVNLIDQRVLRLTPGFFSYTLSKSALWTATRTMAQALAPRIRVNAIAPGPVLPNAYQTDEDFAREWRGTPLERGAAPEEIAEAVVFILRAPAMTGQMIALDGGEHLQYTEQPA
jgi:NAD(P)-dependent dehydrogenase (short-subunit alcohol dehydrogenase family)